ncbi:hypothetical protein BHM03_00030992 [Ensete ventricosum]|nr:hypothetical protein BHM03_00030992 [Ensete ventricosum]
MFLKRVWRNSTKAIEVFLGESSLEETESRIDKDSVQHLHEVVTELTFKVTLLIRTSNAGGSNTHIVPP